MCVAAGNRFLIVAWPPGAVEALLGGLDGAVRIVDARAKLRTFIGHDQGILAMYIVYL